MNLVLPLPPRSTRCCSKPSGGSWNHWKWNVGRGSYRWCGSPSIGASVALLLMSEDIQLNMKEWEVMLYLMNPPAPPKHHRDSHTHHVRVRWRGRSWGQVEKGKQLHQQLLLGGLKVCRNPREKVGGGKKRCHGNFHHTAEGDIDEHLLPAGSRWASQREGQVIKPNVCCNVVARRHSV